MGSLSKAELRAELLDRGHHYLAQEPGRADRMIQGGARELLHETTWEWRRREQVLDVTQTIDDLGRIEEVYGSDGEPLDPSTRAALRRKYRDLTQGGTPQYYWREGTRMGVYPVGTLPTVVYFSEWAWTSSDGTTWKVAPTDEADVLAAPAAFDELVLCLAQVRAYQDIQAQDQAVAMRDEYTLRLEELQSEDGRTNVDEQRRIRIIAGQFD